MVHGTRSLKMKAINDNKVRCHISTKIWKDFKGGREIQNWKSKIEDLSEDFVNFMRSIASLECELDSVGRVFMVRMEY